MTIKTGANHACAACKYQRRRCSKDCVLAPYFPAEKAKLFQYAHRLFGVHNIMKILKQIPIDKHEEAMRSIIYESFIRAIHPVHGCQGVIYHLHSQVQQSFEELVYIRNLLAYFKKDGQYPMYCNAQFHSGISSNTYPAVASSAMPLMPSSSNVFGVESDDDLESKARIHHQIVNQNYVNMNVNLMNDAGQSYYLDFSPQQEIVSHDYGEEIPFDEQSYIESKETFESTSAEYSSSFKNATSSGAVMEDELKSAAARFGLTSIHD